MYNYNNSEDEVCKRLNSQVSRKGDAKHTAVFISKIFTIVSFSVHKTLESMVLSYLTWQILGDGSPFFYNEVFGIPYFPVDRFQNGR